MSLIDTFLLFDRAEWFLRAPAKVYRQQVRNDAYDFQFVSFGSCPLLGTFQKDLSGPLFEEFLSQSFIKFGCYKFGYNKPCKGSSSYLRAILLVCWNFFHFLKNLEAFSQSAKYGMLIVQMMTRIKRDKTRIEG